MDAVAHGPWLVALIEWQLWSAMIARKAKADAWVFIGIHLVCLLGIVVAVFRENAFVDFTKTHGITSRRQVIVPGWGFFAPRFAATYAGLVVLLRITFGFWQKRPRCGGRAGAIAWHSVVEAVRRMWAPWVVIALFIVILAFTHWFIRTDDKGEELSRNYVSVLSVVTTILLLMMIGIVSPISLPNDIQQQTIYTVVSRARARLELIWGRLLGYMALA